MTVRTEPSEKWVRGWLDGEAVVDTRSALLVWEDPFPIPGYAIDPADVRDGLLTPAAGPPVAVPFFFGPKGPVAQWFDVRTAGREIRGVAWQIADPVVADRITFSWQPGLLDRWTEEEEDVAGHPRDPHKRVEAIAGSRHVQVSVGGTVLADSRRPVLLFETDLPTRYYLPPGDVDLSALTPGRQQSHCPYKGVADRYWDLPDMPGIAWSYSDPFPAVGKVAGLIAFYNEMVDLTVDGVAIPRPVSPFSDPANRPAS
jgi:uncharacterized protein (DUF427 family)